MTSRIIFITISLLKSWFRVTLLLSMAMDFTRIRMILLWVLCVSIPGLLYFLAVSNQLQDFADSTHYIALARSLLTTGEYRDIYHPNAPTHTAYPPLFPMILATLSSIFGETLWVFQVVGVLFCFGISFVFYQFLKTHLPLSKTSRVLFLSFLLLSPHLLLFSQKILSETPYLFFSLACLWFLSKGPSSFFYACIFASLAFLTRKIGVVLLPILFLFLWQYRDELLKEKRKNTLFFMTIFLVLPVMSWSIRDFYLTKVPIQLSYLSHTLALDSSQDFFSLWLRRLSIQSVTLAQLIFPPSARFFLEYPIVSVIPNLIVLFGFAVLIRNHSMRWIPIYALLYTCVLFLWPWTSYRFWIPLLPILHLGLVSAFSIRHKSLLLRMIPFLLVLMQFPKTAELSLEIQRGNDRVPDYAQAYERGLLFIRDTGYEGPILCPQERWTYFLTNQKAQGYYFSQLKPETLLKAIQDIQAKLLIYDSYYLQYQRGNFRNPATMIPSCFQLLHQDESFLLYEIEDSCRKPQQKKTL